MRRILALMTVVIGAWYLSNRQRRTQLQGRWQDMVSSLPPAHCKGRTATPGEMAAAARARVANVRSRAAVTASTVAETARRAGDVAAQKAQEATSVAAQSAGDAAGNVQGAPGAAVDRVEQAAKPAAGVAPEPAEPVAGIALGLVEPPSSVAMEQRPVVDRAAEAASHTSGQFVGNKSTRIYRPATSGNLPSERNRIYFDTEEEAGAAGFHPAANRGQPGSGSKRPRR